jgi:hypothetical protein
VYASQKSLRGPNIRERANLTMSQGLAGRKRAQRIIEALTVMMGIGKQDLTEAAVYLLTLTSWTSRIARKHCLLVFTVSNCMKHYPCASCPSRPCKQPTVLHINDLVVLGAYFPQDISLHHTLIIMATLASTWRLLRLH